MKSSAVGRMARSARLASIRAKSKQVPARLTERQRIDAHFKRARSGGKSTAKLAPVQTKTEKATARRKSIMGKAAPAGSGYQNLIRALDGKKKKD